MYKNDTGMLKTASSVYLRAFRYAQNCLFGVFTGFVAMLKTAGTETAGTETACTETAFALYTTNIDTTKKDTNQKIHRYITFSSDGQTPDDGVSNHIKKEIK